MSTQSSPEIMSVNEIFTNASYRVPIYQRAYAWTATEITTLLQDVRDARLSGDPSTPADYYIGSLVVNSAESDGREIFEVVDGQQRLTTLFIVLSVAPRIVAPSAHVPEPFAGDLTFEGRDNAGNDLRRLAKYGAEAETQLSTDGISNAVAVVARHSADTSTDPVNLTAPESLTFDADDLDYLRHHVKILRTELPRGTDLNHYFEVMNTRGEQLEKHEILKAQLLASLPGDLERTIFGRVWDACAVLDRHLQLQFSPSAEDNDPRSRLFGKEWNTFEATDADELFELLSPAVGVDADGGHVLSPIRSRVSLADVLHTDDKPLATATTSDSDSGRYGAIIDFPNFLLHVLKLQEGFAGRSSGLSDEAIRLEDKYLLAEFKHVTDNTDGSQHTERHKWVRQFAFNLAKTRYLLDTYVIRTQSAIAGDDDENWVLHRARKYQSGKDRQLSERTTFGTDHNQPTDQPDSVDVGRRILMLQAMFQVTDTRRASKHFLFDILDWLHRQPNPEAIDGQRFADHLESIARRRLKSLRPLPSLANDGGRVPNFLFNVLDYQLWKLGTGDITNAAPLLDPQQVKDLAKAAVPFRFRYRTSVEHFYPQRPSEGQGHGKLATAVCDQFGNLCIMSRSENSRRNNLMPMPKATEFSSTKQSLKFQLMAEITKRKAHWSEDEINAHGNEMLRLLNDFALDPIQQYPEQP